ncbi:MAG: hypothetical protein F6K26_03285 [Moorea sp. SIO2I5]|nr:hypothetical protein [Moorena sp. SIO2I5]
MATTFSQITQFLDNQNWKYHKIPGQPYILIGITTQHVQQLAVLIKLSENGRYLKFKVPQLLQVKDHVFMGLLFRAMANISYSVKMLRLQYDPMSGEVSASIELPLEDAPLTERQFNRYLEGLVKLVNTTRPRLKAILATGNDPGQKNFVEQLWDAMPTAMQKQLQEIVMRHQAG